MTTSDTPQTITVELTDDDLRNDISHSQPAFTIARKLREVGIPLVPIIDPFADNPFKVTRGCLRWVYWEFGRSYYFKWTDGPEVTA